MKQNSIYLQNFGENKEFSFRQVKRILLRLHRLGLLSLLQIWEQKAWLKRVGPASVIQYKPELTLLLPYIWYTSTSIMTCFTLPGFLTSSTL